MSITLMQSLAMVTLAATLCLTLPGNAAAQPDPRRTTATQLVLQIQKADYEDDRAALKSLHEELQPFIGDKEFGTQVQYWRAFALWRRAINGFNDGVGRPELQADLKQASAEFTDTAKQDPEFVDAKVGALGCMSLLGYIMIENGAQMQDPEVQDLMANMRQLSKDAQALSPENPRLLWVMGPNVWKSPPERGGGEAKALAMYERGLELIRKDKSGAGDPLQPSWGEPELLMSLAYSNLNRSSPDLQAAENYARSALKLEPDWHYVRDILLPQILEAKKQAATHPE